MQDITPDMFDKFQELIYNQCSLHFSPFRMINLEMRLRERVSARKLTSFERYFKLLQEDVEEFNALIEGITTKETYFFRLPKQFEALKNKLVPQIEDRLSKEAQRLMAENGGPGSWRVPFRIWSAGCATGEEPYTIAMTVADSLSYPRAWQTEILATDISKKAITTAGLGSYDTEAVKKIPESYREKYLKINGGGAKVTDELLEKITFRIFNLRNLDMHNNRACTFTKIDGEGEVLDLVERFDMIFCRNVMIYFDIPAQQRLIDELYECLKPGGYLFTGDAESLHIYRHGFETLECEGSYFYQKPELANLPGRRS